MLFSDFCYQFTKSRLFTFVSWIILFRQLNEQINIKGIFLLVIVLPAFLVQSWKVTMVYAWYYANRDKIAERFCENLDRPELMCSGKCHIQKVIEDVKQDRDRWKKSAQVSIDERSITFISPKLYPSTIKVFTPGSEKSGFYYQWPYSDPDHSGVFRPPKLFKAA